MMPVNTPVQDGSVRSYECISGAISSTDRLGELFTSTKCICPSDPTITSKPRTYTSQPLVHTSTVYAAASAVQNCGVRYMEMHSWRCTMLRCTPWTCTPSTCTPWGIHLMGPSLMALIDGPLGGPQVHLCGPAFLQECSVFLHGSLIRLRSGGWWLL